MPKLVAGMEEMNLHFYWAFPRDFQHLRKPAFGDEPIPLYMWATRLEESTPPHRLAAA